MGVVVSQDGQATWSYSISGREKKTSSESYTSWKGESSYGFVIELIEIFIGVGTIWKIQSVWGAEAQDWERRIRLSADHEGNFKLRYMTEGWIFL